MTLRQDPSKPCSYCFKVGHSAFQCGYKPRKKLKPGKQAKAWTLTSSNWYRLNPPDHSGYYYCYICGLAMTKPDTTLDHIESRGRHPELRNELSNLAPCCSRCNTRKGSKSLEEMEIGFET